MVKAGCHGAADTKHNGAGARPSQLIASVRRTCGAGGGRRMARLPTLAGSVAAAALAFGPSLSSSRPRVTPVFWAGQGSPAFAVECANESGVSRELPPLVGASNSIRLDGVVLAGRGVAGSVITRPGENLEVAAGKPFTQIVLFGDSPGRALDFQPQAGTVLIIALGIAPTPGQHSVAFRCWSEWSQEVPFRWVQP